MEGVVIVTEVITAVVPLGFLFVIMNNIVFGVFLSGILYGVFTGYLIKDILSI